MTRFSWSTVAGFGIAGLLVTAAPAQADDEKKQGGTATTTGSDTAQGQSSSTPSSEEDAKKGTGARGSGMGGTSTGARPGEVSGAGTAGATSSTAGAVTGQSELTGKIETYDRQTRTLTLSNSDQKLTLGDNTQVMKNGEPAAPGDLMEGDEVRASYSGSGDSIQIQKLEVLKAGTGEAPARESTGSPSGTSTGKPAGSSSTGGGSPDTTGTTGR
jgi:hypothetical protein